jgi:hypothetical protein
MQMAGEDAPFGAEYPFMAALIAEAGRRRQGFGGTAGAMRPGS